MTKSQRHERLNNSFFFGFFSFYRYIPNLLTTFRLLCTPLLVWFLAYKDFSKAFWIFLAASLTDWLDGYLARRWSVTSKFGQIFDPLADKFLLVAAYVMVSYLGYIPTWLAGLVLVRDFLILSVGASIIFAFHGNIQLPSQWIGKISTTFQMLFIGFILAIHTPSLSIPTSSIPHILMVISLYIVAFTTLISGIIYGKAAIGILRQRS
jgi:cardiolipin synthase